MGFRKLRIAPITTRVSDDGYPVYGAFAMLQTVAASEELNSVEISISNITKTKTLQADDKETEKRVVTRAEGTLKVFDCDAAAVEAMFGYATDANGNTIEKVNGSAKKSFGLFFEGKTAKDVKYQKYLYDVTFDEPTVVAATDSGEDTAALEIPFQVAFIEDAATGQRIRAATVYSGKTGWVAGEPSEMYKESPAPGPSTLTAPVISKDASNVVTWSAVPNAVGYEVVVNGSIKSLQPTTAYAAETAEGAYTIFVIARGDGVSYVDSAHSNSVTYTIAG